MRVEWTSILLHIPLSLKIPKSTRIIQEATAPCQGSRPRSTSCLTNYILRLNSLLSVCFFLHKYPPNNKSSFCLAHHVWAHYFTHHNYNQRTKLKKQSEQWNGTCFLTTRETAWLRLVMREMGALENFRAALLNFSDILNRSNYLRKGKNSSFCL